MAGVGYTSMRWVGLAGRALQYTPSLMPRLHRHRSHNTPYAVKFCVAGQEEEDTQHGSVASVLAAKAETFRYTALGPRGHPRSQTLEC